MSRLNYGVNYSSQKEVVVAVMDSGVEIGTCGMYASYTSDYSLLKEIIVVEYSCVLNGLNNLIVYRR